MPSTSRRPKLADAEREHGVDGDQHQSRLGRTEPAVSQREHAERLRLEVGVDRQDQVRDHDRQPDREQHVGRQPESDPDRRGGEGVNEVVEVVAVARPLALSHPGERAVERIAEPVDDQQGARRPQPHLVAVRQHVRRRDAERRQHTECSEVIRHHPSRQAPRDPLKDARLGRCEQELLLGVRQGCSMRRTCALLVDRWLITHRREPRYTVAQR